jgi:hypothetical protein
MLIAATQTGNTSVAQAMSRRSPIRADELGLPVCESRRVDAASPATRLVADAVDRVPEMKEQ